MQTSDQCCSQDAKSAPDARPSLGEYELSSAKVGSRLLASVADAANLVPAFFACSAVYGAQYVADVLTRMCPQVQFQLTYTLPITLQSLSLRYLRILD